MGQTGQPDPFSGQPGPFSVQSILTVFTGLNRLGPNGPKPKKIELAHWAKPILTPIVVSSQIALIIWTMHVYVFI